MVHNKNRRNETTGGQDKTGHSTGSGKAPHRQIIINDVPNEECRVAVVENGRLEEYFTERESQDLHVGNIYLGRVMNVESGIQAAFIDFGVGRNGFLHITDLHPMYFPGSDQETTEAVGQKTPHRERPPMQACLKRGQEIMVQVLKEGIGNKGPTLTSYISLPGRFLVMMPYMERLGVSRKVEDLDVRREAMQILDSLDLPDGFGFILRTAGLERTKTELKKDLAYLLRLWKNIQKKQETSKGPTELFVESDLLIRAVRDILASSPDEIVVDNPEGLRRIEDYLSVIAPRTRGTKIIGYERPWPIFHYYGIEEQIRTMHGRNVPLPSGGMLVFDSTEAAVVIDVNSAKARHYHDAETTAHKVNQEAVDEVCRQLRLRDLGGLVVVDFIDMRLTSHKRDIENRLRTRLKRDRAKADFLRISEYGIVEMTRQRMRPSLLKAHTADCPSCEGKGKIQAPEPTAFDAMRTAAHYIFVPQIQRLEMVVSTPVAGVLLNKKRKQLTELERRTGKTLEVRVSQTIPLDRVDFYAYDAQGADIALAELRIDLDAVKLPESVAEESTASAEPTRAVDESIEPHLREAERMIAASGEAASAEREEERSEEQGGGRKHRRRRRRGGRGRGGDGEREGVQDIERGAAAQGQGEAGFISPTPESGVVQEGAHVVSTGEAMAAGQQGGAQAVPGPQVGGQAAPTPQQTQHQNQRGPGQGREQWRDQRPRFGGGGDRRDQRRWQDQRGGGQHRQPNQYSPGQGGRPEQRQGQGSGQGPVQPPQQHNQGGRGPQNQPAASGQQPVRPQRPPVSSDRFSEVSLDRFKALLDDATGASDNGSGPVSAAPSMSGESAPEPTAMMPQHEGGDARPQEQGGQDGGGGGRGRRGRRGGRGRGRGGRNEGEPSGGGQGGGGTRPVVTVKPQSTPSAPAPAAATPAAPGAGPKPKRSLYSAFRRLKPGTARRSGGGDEE